MQERALLFLEEMRRGNYPNAPLLAELSGCSRNTAQRTIYRLRDEYLVPLDYDSSKRGYYLTDEQYEVPTALPPGKDELAALLLGRELLRSIESADLDGKLAELWAQFSAHNASVTRDLLPLAGRFSAELTEVADVADLGLLRLVTLAAIGQDISIRYQSPWRHKEPKEYQGRIEQLHYSDGNLYLRFFEVGGREMILNAAFIIELKELSEPLRFTERDASESGARNWRDGFGVWAGGELKEIRIEILPPAARYYAQQRWDETQEDSWDGDVLVRRMSAIPSPELARRLAGIGAFIKTLEPAEVREEVLAIAETTIKNLK